MRGRSIATAREGCLFDLPDCFGTSGEGDQRHRCDSIVPMMTGLGWLHTKTGFALIALVLLLIGARVTAPYALQWVVEANLDGLGGYQATVGDVDLQLWRGGYRIENLAISRSAGAVDELFIAAESIVFSPLWNDILGHGPQFKATVSRPIISLIGDRAPAATVASLRDVVQRLALAPVAAVAVTDGAIAYHDVEAQPALHLYLSRVHVNARHLPRGDGMPIAISARGRLMHSGQAALDMTIAQAGAEPGFALDAALAGLDLVRMETMLAPYLPFDLQAGRFDFNARITAEAGQLKGQLAPRFYELQIQDWGEATDRQPRHQPLRRLVAWLSAAGKVVAANPSRTQFAATIPVSGQLPTDQPPTLAATLVVTLGHAFAAAPAARATAVARATPDPVELAEREASETAAAESDSRTAAQRNRAPSRQVAGANPSLGGEPKYLFDKMAVWVDGFVDEAQEWAAEAPSEPVTNDRYLKGPAYNR